MFNYWMLKIEAFVLRCNRFYRFYGNQRGLRILEFQDRGFSTFPQGKKDNNFWRENYHSLHSKSRPEWKCLAKTEGCYFGRNNPLHP